SRRGIRRGAALHRRRLHRVLGDGDVDICVRAGVPAVEELSSQFVKRETLIAGAVFAALPVVVLTLALIATYAVAHGAPAYVRLPFRFICHGIPRRCLTIWNTPMPICARCTAIYAGLLTGLLLFPL